MNLIFKIKLKYYFVIFAAFEIVLGTLIYFDLYNVYTAFYANFCSLSFASIIIRNYNVEKYVEYMGHPADMMEKMSKMKFGDEELIAILFIALSIPLVVFVGTNLHNYRNITEMENIFTSTNIIIIAISIAISESGMIGDRNNDS